MVLSDTHFMLNDKMQMHVPLSLRGFLNSLRNNTVLEHMVRVSQNVRSYFEVTSFFKAYGWTEVRFVA